LMKPAAKAAHSAWSTLASITWRRERPARRRPRRRKFDLSYLLAYPVSVGKVKDCFGECFGGSLGEVVPCVWNLPVGAGTYFL